MLDLTNTGLGTIIFDPEEVLEILDLRSLGYYKIKTRYTTAKCEQILQI